MLTYSMWATQYTPNNNLDANTPGILQDGRQFTDYSQDSMVNDRIRKENQLLTNEDYRRFLVRQTEPIMKYNYEQMVMSNHPTSYDTTLHGGPYLYDSVQDVSKPYGYEGSNPKNNYLSREQIDDKKRRLYKEEY